MMRAFGVAAIPCAGTAHAPLWCGTRRATMCSRRRRTSSCCSIHSGAPAARLSSHAVGRTPALAARRRSHLSTSRSGRSPTSPAMSTRTSSGTVTGEPTRGCTSAPKTHGHGHGHGHVYVYGSDEVAADDVHEVRKRKRDRDRDRDRSGPARSLPRSSQGATLMTRSGSTIAAPLASVTRTRNVRLPAGAVVDNGSARAHLPPP
jgi:hypothetical protein